MSRVGFAPVPPPRAYSTKEGHPILFLSTQLPWGRNQEPPSCAPLGPCSWEGISVNMMLLYGPCAIMSTKDLCWEQERDPGGPLERC